MFPAKYISRKTGISKANNKWYMVELIADTLDGNATILKSFCTENAYNTAADVRVMEEVSVQCGVDNKGHIVINAVRKKTNARAE